MLVLHLIVFPPVSNKSRAHIREKHDGEPSRWMVFLSFEAAAQDPVSVLILQKSDYEGSQFLIGGWSGEECSVHPLYDDGVGEVVRAQSSREPVSEKLNWIRAFTTLR